MSESVTPEVRAILDDALSQVARAAENGEGAMVGKWTVVVEYTNADGAIYCMRYGSADSSIWDRLGLLLLALEAEKATLREQQEDA